MMQKPKRKRQPTRSGATVWMALASALMVMLVAASLFLLPGPVERSFPAFATPATVVIDPPGETVLAVPAGPAPPAGPIPVPCEADALIDAISTANDRAGADTLELRGDCIYTLSSVIESSWSDDVTALPRITGDLSVRGGGGTRIERGDDTPRFRMFEVANDARLTLIDLSLRGGDAPPADVALDALASLPAPFDGGAIYSHSGALELVNVTLSGHLAAGHGGAIYNHSGTISLTGVALRDNAAGMNGGAIYSHSASMTLTDVVIEANRAGGDGGGLYTHSGPLTLTDVALVGNQAGDSGGGLYDYAGPLTAQNLTVEANRASRYGGGLYNYEAALRLSGEAQISANHAADDGGGLWMYRGDADLGTARIEDNVSDGRGGGLWVYNARVIVSNAAFAGNAGARGDGQLWAYPNATLIAPTAQPAP